MIEQIITGTRHKDLQKELLSKGKTLTLKEALDEGRSHEASLMHMRQLAEVQGPKTSQAKVDYVKQKDLVCRNCGGRHPRNKCPAWGATCSKCSKLNHWAKVCMSEKGGEKKQSGGKAQRSKPKDSRKKPKQQSSSVCAVAECEDPSLYEQFEQLSFDMISKDSAKQDTRSEVFLSVDIVLSHIKGTHTLKAKVDTGAEGNTLPLRTYKKMLPHNVGPDGLPKPGTAKPSSTTLTAYNGSRIPKYGVVTIPCTMTADGRTLTSTWSTPQVL